MLCCAVLCRGNAVGGGSSAEKGKEEQPWGKSRGGTDGEVGALCAGAATDPLCLRLIQKTEVLSADHLFH